MTEQELLERLRDLDGPVEPHVVFRDLLYQRLQAERSAQDDALADAPAVAGGVTPDLAEISVTSKPLSTGRRWAAAAAAFVAVALVGATTIWLAPGSEPEPPILSSPDTPSTSAAEVDSAPDTTGSADQPGELVFGRPLPWTLVFDNGAYTISALDLNHDEPRIVEVDGSRGGDQPYRLTVHDGHLVVGWGQIYGYDTTTLESALLGEATIHVPASAPSRVWMIDYPSGRIGPGPPEVWQVHVAGGQTTERHLLDVDGHPAHGIPGGLALESDLGVVLWDAESGDAAGTLGTGAGSVSDVTVDGKLAWCENTCDEMRITDLINGTEIPVSHPTGGAFEARAARFSDDGRYLAAPSGTGVVLVDIATGDSQLVITFPAGVEPPSFVAWAPDSHVVFAASYSYGEFETTVGYYSAVSDTTEVSTLPHGGTLSFVVLPTHEANVVLGAEPVDKAEAAPSPDCPVTAPERLFTPPRPYPPDPVDEDMVWYGTNELWTMIDPNGQVWRDLPVGPDGDLTQKTLWWSQHLSSGESAEIRITAEHLNGSAPTVEVSGPGGANSSPSSPSFGIFMVVGFELPQPGCWEITAEYRGATVSYVVWIDND